MIMAPWRGYKFDYKLVLSIISSRPSYKLIILDFQPANFPIGNGSVSGSNVPIVNHIGLF
jgi:hypothetical protein